MQDLFLAVISPSPASYTFVPIQQKCLHFAGKFIKSIIELITLIYLGLCTVNLLMHYTPKRQSAESFHNQVMDTEQKVTVFLESYGSTETWIRLLVCL